MSQATSKCLKAHRELSCSQWLVVGSLGSNCTLGVQLQLYFGSNCEFLKSMGQNYVVTEHLVVLSNIPQLEYLIESGRQCEDLPRGN